jgi:hypothetical protein
MRLPFDMRGIGGSVGEAVITTPGVAHVYAYSLAIGDRVHMPGGVGTVRHKALQAQYVALTIDQYTRKGKGPIRLHTWELLTTPLSLWQLA